MVVDQGVALDAVPPWSRDGCDPHFCQPEPRSAIGVSQDGETLILATIDGRYAGASGMTSKQVGVLMAEMGAWRALNLDGGGSSTLWIEAEGGVVNRPSDGCCRTVSNHLGVEIVDPATLPDAGAAPPPDSGPPAAGGDAGPAGMTGGGCASTGAGPATGPAALLFALLLAAAARQRGQRPARARAPMCGTAFEPDGTGHAPDPPS